MTFVNLGDLVAACDSCIQLDDGVNLSLFR